MSETPVTAVETDESTVEALTFAQFGEGFDPAWSVKNTRERISEVLPPDRANVPPAPIQPWDCRIGGSRFFVPPLSINVSQVFKAGGMTGSVLRQQTPPKFNTGHTETVITMTLYFPSYEDIWGFEDEIFDINFEEDEHTKIDAFMSSLRGLIAQFKYAPFLPIRNVFLNKTFGITGVVLKDINISSIPNFPFCVAVNLTMYKFNHKVYLPMVEHFDQAVHWGRFRSYLARGMGRLVQSSRPIKAFSNINRPPRDPSGEVTPSVRSAKDILDEARAQADFIPTTQTYRRHAVEEINRLDFFFPFHTPARVDLPDLSEMKPSPEVIRRQKSWWENLLAVVGINVNTNPDAHFDSVRKMTEEFGSGHIIETGEHRALVRYLQIANLIIQHMNLSEMNKYINHRLQEEGIIPGTTAAEAKSNTIRRTWFYVMYRMFLEDPLLANRFALQDRKRRELTLNEWEIPMWRLDLDYDTVKLTGISVNMGNTISRLQLQMQDEPTHQHIGGEGARVDLSFIVSGPNAEVELLKLRLMFQSISGLARLEHGHGVIGFLGVQSVLTALCGIRYCVPLGFEVETIPNFPHVYQVNISLTDFDVFQQKREILSAEQQAELVEAFGKNNPFLRFKQLFGFFNAYPDFPLQVRDDEGNIVGHLDPDYYFRSFKAIDDDIIDSRHAEFMEAGPATQSKTRIDEIRDAMDDYRSVEGDVSRGSDRDWIEEPGAHLVLGEIDGKPQTVSVTDDGISIRSGDESFADNVKFREVGAHNLITETTVEGITPLSQYGTPTFADDPFFHFSTMAKDMQYRDKSARMVRAFPSYMLWLIDEAGPLGGMRLFDNFYGLQSVIDLSVVQSEDILGDTLVIRVSNIYSKLSTKFHDYLDEHDPGARIINTFMTRKHRLLSQSGYIIDLDTIRLQPGIRLHLRLGYGSDPRRLDTVFNGTITEVHNGEIITIIAQSDAIELGALVNSQKESGHSGKIGGSMFGLHVSEPRDLMIQLLTSGSSRVKELIAHATRGSIYSENRFGIKHFGTILYAPLDVEEINRARMVREEFKTEFEATGDLVPISSTLFRTDGSDEGYGFLVNSYIRDIIGSIRSNMATRRDYEIFKRNIYPGNGTGVAQYMGGDLGDIGLNMAIDGDEELITGVGLDPEGVPNDILTGEPATDIIPTTHMGPTLEGILGEDAHETRNTSVWRTVYETLGLIPTKRTDDSPFNEIAFRAQTYMKSVWDLFKVCAALLPDYIVAVRPFEQRSTVFYGKPHWLYTSGVIPLSTGIDPPPIEEPDLELRLAQEHLTNFMKQEDDADAFEAFFQGIGDYRPGTVSNSDPTMSTSGLPYGDVTGPQLAARAAYNVGFRGEDLVTMVAIAGAESTWNPNAKNSKSSATGLWQIKYDIWKNVADLKSRDDLLDVDTNARVAKMATEDGLAKRHGKFSAWAVHPDSSSRGFHTPNNTHAQHLATAREAVEAEIKQQRLEPDSQSPDQELSKEEARVESVWAEFRRYFPNDSTTLQRFLSSFAEDVPDEEKMALVEDGTYETVVLGFMDFLWNDERSRVWLGVVANRRLWRGDTGPIAAGLRAQQEDIRRGVSAVIDFVGGIVGVGEGAFDEILRRGDEDLLTREWDFGPAYDVFVLWLTEGDEGAREYMKDNARPGLSTNSLWMRSGEIGFRAVRSVTDAVGRVLSTIRNIGTGLVAFMRVSILQLYGGLRLAADMQRQANKLNSIFNDSIYYSAGVVDGEVVNRLLFWADNPFTREYGEPVAEIREPFQRMHMLGSSQHIISNAIIETMDDVSTVVTATSDGDHPVTVHFDKGISSEKQFEKAVDTGLVWDTPRGFWGRVKSLFTPTGAFKWHREAQMIKRGASPQTLAKRVALSHLKESLKDIYQGELTILGDSSIRPHDLVYIHDSYSRLYGFVEVEQVVHHFTPETGFVTQVTPNACVTINDPARFLLHSYWRSRFDIKNVREHIRNALDIKVDYEDSAGEETPDLNLPGFENMTLEDIEELAADALEGSLQYFGGSSMLVKTLTTAMRLAPASVGGTLFLGWPLWRWVRDNLLDQHGCYIYYLTHNGQHMDAGLTEYNQSVAVGHQWSKGVIIAGLNIGRISTLGPDGNTRIRAQDVLPALQWDETGPNDLAQEVSWFVDRANSAVRGVARRSEFLENFASEVYWAEVTFVFDGDTFDVNVLGHIRGGEFMSTNVRLNPDNRIRLAGVDAPEDDFKFDPERAALQFDDPGVRATDYAKEHLLGKEVALRIVNTDREDQFQRTVAMVFHNAPDGLEGDDRRDWILRAAAVPPVAPWDGYMSDGKPYTFNWQLVAAGHGFIFTNDLRRSIPGSGVVGSN